MIDIKRINNEVDKHFVQSTLWQEHTIKIVAD